MSITIHHLRSQVRFFSRVYHLSRAQKESTSTYTFSLRNAARAGSLSDHRGRALTKRQREGILPRKNRREIHGNLTRGALNDIHIYM